jgi:hypothetical protein
VSEDEPSTPFANFIESQLQSETDDADTTYDLIKVTVTGLFASTIGRLPASDFRASLEGDFTLWKNLVKNDIGTQHAVLASGEIDDVFAVLAKRVQEYDDDSEDLVAIFLLEILELYQGVGKYENNRNACIETLLTVSVHLYRLY